MNDEIAGGLRNAMERGATIEQAMQSFINAGYNPAEVRDAAQYITQGVSTIINPPQQQPAQPQQPRPVEFSKSMATSQSTQQAQQLPMQALPQAQFLPPSSPQQLMLPKKKSSGKKLSIILVVIFILLVLLLIGTLLFGEKVLDLLFAA